MIDYDPNDYDPGPAPDFDSADFDLRPPHADKLYADRKAAALIDQIIKVIENESWEHGAFVTATVIGDRFGLPSDESEKALKMLETRGYLEKIGTSYYRK